MSNAGLSLSIFILCYVLFVSMPKRRSLIACIGGLFLIFTTDLSWHEVVFEKVSWNVIGLFLGTLVLAELFLRSRVPAVMAEWLVDKCRSTRIAMLTLCALSGFISIFVENVAVVLLVAPIALSLSKKLKINPIPLLIGISLSSNLQGTATMIGDPPSMILAGYMRMGFWDFFVYHGKLSIFFAVQIGMLVSLLVLFYLFRRQTCQIERVAQEKARSWIPTGFLGILVVGLSFATLIDPEFQWFAGAYTMGLSLLGIVWFQLRARWKTTTLELIKKLDWDTTLFLIGIFALVGALSDAGWMDRLADLMSTSAASDPLLAFLMVVVLAVFISGFVDNVPFLLVMIPVVQKVAVNLNVTVPLLMFGLLIGSCLGGNLTPFGASANIVTIGILRQQGREVRFADFLRISVPFTVITVLCSCLFVWYVWG